MKIRNISVVLLFIFLLTIFGGAFPAYADIPQSGYGFEDGMPQSVKSYGGAALDITDDYAYTGGHSLFVSNRKNATDGMCIDLISTAAVGAKYSVTAWVYLPQEVSGGKMGVYIRKNSQDYKINSANLSGGKWTRISGSVSPDLSDVKSLQLVISSADSNKYNFYVDDITISVEGGAVQLASSQTENVNLLPDSSFESGTTGSAEKRFSTITAVDNVSSEGANSLLVSNRKETYGGVEFDVKDLLKKDSTYKASVKLRLKEGTPECYMYFQLELKEQGQEVHYPIIGGGKITDDVWTEFSGLIHTADFTYPLERAKIYVASMDENTNDFYADEFYLAYTTETGEEDKDKITEFPTEPVNLPVMPVYINWYEEEQNIDGFGASGAFGTANEIRKMQGDKQKEVLDLLFTDKGADLSILRNRINPGINPQKGVYEWNEGEDQIWLTNQARERGVETVMSTAWSPPAWMKTTGSVIGGELKEENYRDYAEYLAEYIIQYEKQFGITIDVISMANEPNLSPDYDGCLWSDKQITKWIRDYAKPVFAEKGITARLMAAEDMNFSEARVADALSDSEAAERLDIVGVHGYGGGYSKLSVSEYANKPIWMTEVLGYHEFNTTILDGLVWAKRIHQHMAIANVSAWNYWYGASTSKHSNGALLMLDTAKNTITIPKRFYAIANYSRFVQPGDCRISATLEPGDNVYITAFKNSDNKLTFVAVNGNVNQQQITLNLNGAKTSSFDGYCTDDSQDLAYIGKVDANAPISLPARSVTTFVAEVTETEAIPVADYMGTGKIVNLPTINATYGTPTVDGNIDSVWAQAQTVTTNIWGDGSINTTGATAQVRTMWNDEYYFVLMEVKDSRLSAENKDNYMQDCVEIFLDENCAQTGFYQKDDVQYRIGCFNDCSFTDNCDKERFKSVVKETADGYLVEAAIPFTTVTPKSGMVMGTEFQVTDEYGANTRSISKWATDSGNSYFDTSTFGKLCLVGGADEIAVVLNGERIAFDVPPVLVNDRTMIPFRKVLEAMGAKVDYIDAEQKVTAQKDGISIELIIGSNKAIADGSEYTLDAAPFVQEGRTLIPLRFMAEALGAQVEWIENINTVNINY